MSDAHVFKMYSDTTLNENQFILVVFWITYFMFHFMFLEKHLCFTKRWFDSETWTWDDSVENVKAGTWGWVEKYISVCCGVPDLELSVKT